MGKGSCGYNCDDCPTGDDIVTSCALGGWCCCSQNGSRSSLQVKNCQRALQQWPCQCHGVMMASDVAGGTVTRIIKIAKFNKEVWRQ